MTVNANLILQSIQATEQEIKLDIDDDLPEHRRLQRVFNFLYLFPEGRIERHPRTNGLHLFDDSASNLTIRRGLGDCKGRLLWSEERGGDIIFKKKGRFKVKMINGEMRPVWLQKPTGYVPIDLDQVLALPFAAKIPRGVFVKRA